jgi:ABC-type polysaccharide/polyol phosphate transport system ATPase subunit
MNVIEVNRISKKFRLGAGSGDMRDRFKTLFSRDPEAQTARDFWALQDISFNVAEGESFGIIGHNGSGKSTLLKLLTGIYKPTSGTFKTQGRIAALIEVGAGFHQDLTGRENVYLNGSVLGMKKREIDRRYDEIVAFAELEKFMDTPVKRYSSGMYMRLGFAVAAHIDPDIILVDEVLAVGDESFQTKCMKRMQDLRREGKTIIFISHSMDSVRLLCKQVLLLSHGNVLAIGEPAEVITQYRTTAALERNSAFRLSSDEELSPGELSDLEASILSVRVLDQFGQPCEQIETGDSVQLECNFRANTPIPDAAFGIAIFRADGIYVYGPNTYLDNIDVEALDGDGRVTLTYESVNLLPGMYHFKVAIFHKDDTMHPIIAWERAATLTVSANNLSGGIVDLAHSWEIKAQIGAMETSQAIAVPLSV